MPSWGVSGVWCGGYSSQEAWLHAASRCRHSAAVKVISQDITVVKWIFIQMTSRKNQVWIFGVAVLWYLFIYLFIIWGFIVQCLMKGMCLWTGELPMRWGFVMITEMAVNRWSQHVLNRVWTGPNRDPWGAPVGSSKLRESGMGFGGAKLWRLLMKTREAQICLHYRLKPKEHS